MRKYRFVYPVLFSFILFITALTHAADSPGSYKAQRDEMLQQRKNGPDPFSADDKRIMKQAADKLAASMTNPGLSIGTRAPDFTLTNAYNKPVHLYDELQKGPVVLVFYRGAWCPFCNLHLHALEKILPELKKYNAQLITVTPQKPDKSIIQMKQGKLPFEILSDLDSHVMKAYNMLYQLPEELVKVYKKHGLDIEEFNGPGRNILPVPGTYIIDTHAVIRAMHADVDYKERMEPVDILNVLKNLKR